MPLHTIPTHIKADVECGIFNQQPGAVSVSMRDTHFEITISPTQPIPATTEIIMGGEHFPIRYSRGKVYSLASPQLLMSMMMARPVLDDISCRTCVHDKLKGGIAISHRLVTSGTLGGFVYMNENSMWAMLTNYHVGAGIGAMKGDDWLQPGRVDPEPRVIGHLERFIPVKFLSNPNEFVTHDKMNTVDAAIGIPLEGMEKTREIIDMGFPQGTKPVSVGQSVRKSGRTSGTNSTVVKSTNVSIKVNYGTDENPRFAVFDDLIEIGPSILPGDSGSLLVDSAGYAVGLVFAGSFDDNNQPLSGYACKIANVLRSLNCTMLRQSTTPPPTANEDVEYPSGPVSVPPEATQDLMPMLIVGSVVLGVGLLTNFNYEKVLQVLN